VSGSLRLLAAGDLSLGGSLRGASAGRLHDLVEPVRASFAAADLRFVSFDCAIGTAGDPPNPDEYVVDCEVQSLSLLEELGIDVAALANNHSTDRGMEALVDGMTELDRRGIAAVGAGATLEQANAPTVVERGGLRVGFVAAASTHPWVGALAATDASGGVSPLEPEALPERVRRLRDEVDAVVVSVHWGKEYIPLPPPEHVDWARACIDAGAAVVLGHHPHVIQPVEQVQGGVICYSLGNFLFPDDPAQGLRFRGEQRESLLVSIDLTREGGRLVDVVPVVGDATSRVEPVEHGQRITARIAADALLLGTPRHGAAWQAAVRRHEMQRLRRVFREEVIAAGWRGGTARLLSLGRKNLVSVGRSLGEILGGRA
jgi:poly-gamma-glutamate capsule biosynthesis protein CapA/YwtB (metallophosphatase superfamily)